MTKQLYILLFSLLGIISFGTSAAQSLTPFKERLATPLTSPVENGTGIGARVTVEEYGDANEIVASAGMVNPRMHFKGYRVCIFFDNGQNARSEAVEAKTLFQETYPDIPIYTVYENPYFKVTVGDCLTVEEAIILQGRISATFPKAFHKNENLTIANLLK